MRVVRSHLNIAISSQLSSDRLLVEVSQSGSHRASGSRDYR
ncbi:hypothetical protein [Oscillatoria sp. FACHB-1407]|nr:hypothetical protein [Oscillatoria sp. FACHB-1407]